jgi:hypothetical protein
MSEEVEVVADITPAPEQVATAAPEPAVETPEADNPNKTFTQEELDAAIGKRLAREQRKWEREQALRASQALPAASAELPTADQFDSVDAYAEALATKKAEELLATRDIKRQQVEMQARYLERVDEAIEKYTDFTQVVENPALHITPVMADTIRTSDVGPDVAYYLGSNPREAERIASLAPFLQAKEIGKLEAKMLSNPPVKKTTSAPPPIAPVNARGGNTAAYDTTDPRSIKTMSTSEWIEAERLRQIKKAESRRY